MSAEPGGDELMLQNLENHEIKDLGFLVHSDPEFKLLPEPHDAMFVFAPLPDAVAGYEPRTFVQPAMLFLDSSGNIETAWSWQLNKDVLDMVDIEDAELIETRPRQSDIIASLTERRMVETERYPGPVKHS